MKRNTYLQKCRQESQVLNPVNNSLNRSFIPSDINNLKTWLLEIHGNGNGEYYDPGNAQSFPDDRNRERGFVPSKINRLQLQLKELDEAFKKYAQDRLNVGDREPTEWPEHLKVKRLEIEAQITVCHEEIQKLHGLITQAEERNPRRGSLLTHPRDWSSGRLRDGILVTIGPWKVAMDAEKGVLCIMDESSFYNGIEIWKFKSQITRAMGVENSFRLREEIKNALAEGRPRRDVKYPKPPSYDAKTGNIEYPASYSPTTIKKIKQES